MSEKGRCRWKVEVTDREKGGEQGVYLKYDLKYDTQNYLQLAIWGPQPFQHPLWLDSTSSRFALSMGHSESVISCSNSTSDSPFSLRSNRPLPVTAIYQPSVDCLTHCCHFLAMPELAPQGKSILLGWNQIRYSFCLCFQKDKAILGN